MFCCILCNVIFQYGVLSSESFTVYSFITDLTLFLHFVVIFLNDSLSNTWYVPSVLVKSVLLILIYGIHSIKCRSVCFHFLI